jgi:hypothetical protein
MAIFTGKGAPGAVFPANASESAWRRVEPLLTPQQLVDRFLFGVNLASAQKDHNGKIRVLTLDLLKDFIDLAVADVELDSGIDIFPQLISEKHPWDQNDYISFGYLKVHRRPVAQVAKLSISPSTNVDIFTVPSEWIETAYLSQGQINILPITAALGVDGMVPATAVAGAVFLQLLGNRPWVPSFWMVQYTSGFPDGMVPKQVNDLIGVYAAIRVLSLLAASNAKSQSHSLGIDGLSQSISNPGPQVYAQRIGELEEEKKNKLKKLKTLFGLKLFSGQI